MEGKQSGKSKRKFQNMASRKPGTTQRIYEGLESGKKAATDRQLQQGILCKQCGARESVPTPETPKEFIYQRAIETWGMDLQAVCAVEEMAELTQAITKEIREGGMRYREPRENLYEEIADVEIMLEQVVWWIHRGRQKVDEYKKMKLKRLDEVIKKKEVQKNQENQNGNYKTNN